MRLRTSDPERPGWQRVRHGRGFRYLDEAGWPLPAADRARVRALVIPPAWRDVWICPWPNGHLQAVGTDAAGRRQYLYHEEYRARQERAKHTHVREVAEALPRLRKAVEQDLTRRGLCRERVLACAARLLDLGFLRVGGERYQRDNDSYGLSTLRREHVRLARGRLVLDFSGKAGKRITLDVADESVRRVVRALLRRNGGGDRLFAYWEGRTWHDLRADELNAYLRERSGTEMSAKDFRTWHATVLAAVALAVSEQAGRDSVTARRRAVRRAVCEVADYLGNTPAVCRTSYIAPRVLERYAEGETVSAALGRLGEHGEFGHPATQGAVERAVLDLLDGEGAHTKSVREGAARTGATPAATTRSGSARTRTGSARAGAARKASRSARPGG
ncbi:DNA topoisomerase IB [Streptomyces tritici]|uniref:DNA topoisomerase IB n=1 Tax=Streptomyces tritici TaxID=2054410 RepID=UPI003AEF6718